MNQYKAIIPTQSQASSSQNQVQPLKSTRGYMKFEDEIKPHIAFITTLQSAGKKQKEIRQALKEERGLVLKPHQLKRTIDKIGLSKRQLTKRRKLYIYRKLRQRRLLGKDASSLPRVLLKESGRELSQEETQDIMDTSLGYLQGATPELKDIVIDTPTPKPSIDRDGEYGQDGEYNQDEEYNKDEGYNQGGELDINAIGESLNAVLDGDTPMYSEDDINTFSIPYIPQQEENHDQPEDTGEELIKIISTNVERLSLKQDKNVAASPNPENIPLGRREKEEIPLDGPSLVWEPGPQIASDADVAQEKYDDDDLTKYSREHQQNYRHNIERWVYQALEVVKAVESISETYRISLEKAEDVLIMVIMEETAEDAPGMMLEEYEPLPYHICKQILGGKSKNAQLCATPSAAPPLF
ncbi:hypothetical protein ABW20_dc0105675 [Dactylellina cionopaga]|nr:hypothetical protein ABW20_dc0105675 [Dactylellina cionopaga]